MSLILDRLPTAEEFFQTYWNKKPFVVRAMIPNAVTHNLIDEDYLAGLSMEEEVKSRLVRKGADPSDWRCDLGPFEEEVFDELGDEDWSLLVQNIDQYHDETAELLKHFNFCPRWLLDDIMVSFSPKGGTVGAHMDSYHVFLVQGKGERRWKIANEALDAEEYIEDIPLKILKQPFEGEDVTVTEGDVIYIPPKFAHQGISLQPSLTYSVGFLGPTLSEMLIEFGHHIEEHHSDIPRYLGQNLSQNAAPFQLASKHVGDIKSFMTNVFDEEYFAKWLTVYFCTPAHALGDDYEEDDEQEEIANALDLIAQDAQLVKPASIKVMFVPLQKSHTYYVSVGSVSFELAFSELSLVDAIAQETPFTAAIFESHVQVLQELLEGECLKLMDF